MIRKDIIFRSDGILLHKHVTRMIHLHCIIRFNKHSKNQKINVSVLSLSVKNAVFVMQYMYRRRQIKGLYFFQYSNWERWIKSQILSDTSFNVFHHYLSYFWFYRFWLGYLLRYIICQLRDLSLFNFQKDMPSCSSEFDRR